MRKRLIPVLLLDGARRLVKTERFGARTYIGDPFNVVRLFNEKEVDEIAILDIDAGPEGRRPDFGFMKELASECFMPLSYGGGIRSVADCEELNRLGVEKFVLGQGGFEPEVVRSVSEVFGSQAVVVCIDAVGSGDRAHCVTRSGRQGHKIHPLTHALAAQAAGAGEIILQSVDRDGTRSGMDLDMVRRVSQSLEIPVVALGGAGDISHLMDGLAAGASAVASGSAFTFIGRRRAVLVTYPSRWEVDVAMVRSGAGGP
jgi:cyclase